MVNTTPSRLGQSNGAGDEYALFLKKFSGEVLATFDEHNVMKQRHRIRTIDHGKSAQFPFLGTANAAYHEPGENILDPTNGLLSTVDAAEKVINIDNFLTSAIFIPEIDELMNHYDVRSEYAKQQGLALAYQYDRNLLQLAILGAQLQTPYITAQTTKVGSEFVDADFNTNADSAIATIAAWAQACDEKDVPMEGRTAVVSPQCYYTLAQSTTILSRDWNAPNGGIAQGKVFQVAGVDIVMSNHIPTGVVAADSSANNTYSGDFSNTLAVFFQTQGLGSVHLKDITTEMNWKQEYIGTLSTVRMAVGHGFLRQECLGVVTSV